MTDKLNNYLSIWDRKPILRAVYVTIFTQRIAAACASRASRLRLVVV